MSEQTENQKQVAIAIRAMNRINAAVNAYEQGKVTLYNGIDVPFSSELIATLKGDFVSSKQTLIAALDAITAD